MTTTATLRIELTNGATVVTFEQISVGDLRSYTLYCGDQKRSYKTATEFNDIYQRYRKAGWRNPAEKAAANTVTKKVTEKPKKASQPTWDFGDKGFDRNEYLRIAAENKWDFCDARGHIHVMKKHREEIYLLMGAKKLR